MTDVDAVYNIIKNVYELRQYGRERQTPEELADRRGAERVVVFLWHGNSP